MKHFKLKYAIHGASYPPHMFWLSIKINNFQLRTLIWGPDVCDICYEGCSNMNASSFITFFT